MRANTIKLIHVARRSLGLDDETYRVFLGSVVPGKRSCRDMSTTQLQAVLDALKERGFRPVSSRHKASSGIAGKIRAVWFAMHTQGFVTSNDNAAIDSYVKRITRQQNGGEGVAKLNWLRDEKARTVLESLKRWHMRCMLEHLPDNGLKPTYDAVCARYQKMLSN
ncbi:regulatory protein GemA [Citrobacter sp. wls718]|uniref:gp16 family protein n=1 Tax=Citrobacter sp. wls718 TaxID=2576418 RepID=UPI000E042208|nr:regulatory protein GemA [Citrobacter sp. wls718]TKU26447.1 regulatory protein GemA [Citrobacter sp. wls718]STE16817.1 Mu prophage; modulation of host gene protein [Escherichia coli]